MQHFPVDSLALFFCCQLCFLFLLLFFLSPPIRLPHQHQEINTSTQSSTHQHITTSTHQHINTVINTVINTSTQCHQHITTSTRVRRCCAANFQWKVIFSEWTEANTFHRWFSVSSSCTSTNWPRTPYQSNNNRLPVRMFIKRLTKYGMLRATTGH
jgi:hypothetical protein